MLFLSLPLQAHAADSASFSLDTKQTSVNRLVDIGVHAQSNQLFCAALFSFTFDTALLEFRGVSTPAGAKTEHHLDGSTLTVSYLCAQGTKIADNPAVFTLSFKAIATGSASIAFSVKECVNADVVFIPVGSCNAGQVTIGGTAAATEKAEKTTSVKTTSAKTKKDKQKQKKKDAQHPSSASDGEEDADALTDLGTISNVVQQEPDRLTPLIVLIVSVVAGILFLVYFIYRIKTDRKNKNGSGRRDD